MKCAFCGKSIHADYKLEGERYYHPLCYLRLQKAREKNRKQTIAEREQLRLLEWFN